MISVAVDGPAGAGKSTICRQVAEQLGFVYVDTGALYRGVGLFVLGRGVKTEDTAAVEELLTQLRVDLRFEDGAQQVLTNGENVTALIRTPEVSMAASRVSAIPAVRQFLFDTQRRLARENDVLMDGRDIGTVVLPDATVKIFLTAPLEVRAKRRLLELTEKGQSVDFDSVLREMAERDHNDSNRPVAPLRQAEDAVLLDNGELDFQESVQRMIEIIQKGVAAKQGEE